MIEGDRSQFTGTEKVKSIEKMLYEECGAIYVMHHWKEFPEALKKVEAS